jgi:hypothetical protein
MASKGEALPRSWSEQDIAPDFLDHGAEEALPAHVEIERREIVLPQETLNCGPGGPGNM